MRSWQRREGWGVDCVSKRGLAPDVDDQRMTDVLSRVSVVEYLTRVSKM
jgi:hypothetical protein